MAENLKLKSDIDNLKKKIEECHEQKAVLYLENYYNVSVCMFVHAIVHACMCVCMCMQACMCVLSIRMLIEMFHKGA